MAAIHHLIRIKQNTVATFTALTTNEGIARWFTETQCDSWAVDSPVIWFDSTHMIITEFEENYCIAFHVDSGGGWDNTDIRFELEYVDDKTVVRFDHSGWPQVSDHFRDCSVSWAYFLESLKLYLETGEGTPERESPACESEHQPT